MGEQITEPSAFKDATRRTIRVAFVPRSEPSGGTQLNFLRKPLSFGKIGGGGHQADSPPKGSGKQRGLAAGVVTVISALTLALLPAVAANAAPVYELTASWEAGTPTTVTSGDVVTGIWRLNVNDDAAAPSSAPVDNVTFTATVANGRFDTIPSLCLTTGVI